MEKEIKNKGYANYILEKLTEYNKIGFKTSAYMMACECIDYFEEREDLTYHDRCTILAISYDLMDHLQKQGYYKENEGLYHQVKVIENIVIESVNAVGPSFKFEISEKLEKEEC